MVSRQDKPWSRGSWSWFATSSRRPFEQSDHSSQLTAAPGEASRGASYGVCRFLMAGRVHLVIYRALPRKVIIPTGAIPVTLVGVQHRSRDGRSTHDGWPMRPKRTKHSPPMGGSVGTRLSNFWRASRPEVRCPVSSDGVMVELCDHAVAAADRRWPGIAMVISQCCSWTTG